VYTVTGAAAAVTAAPSAGAPSLPGPTDPRLAPPPLAPSWGRRTGGRYAEASCRGNDDAAVVDSATASRFGASDAAANAAASAATVDASILARGPKPSSANAGAAAAADVDADAASDRHVDGAVDAAEPCAGSTRPPVSKNRADRPATRALWPSSCSRRSSAQLPTSVVDVPLRL